MGTAPRFSTRSRALLDVAFFRQDATISRSWPVLAAEAQVREERALGWYSGRLKYIRGERAPLLFTFARAETCPPPAPLSQPRSSRVQVS